MKNVLYIGNNLNSKTSNVSGIQTLGPLLESEGFTLFYASSKFNKVLRLLDMLWNCLKLSKKADVVLIDTYSTQNFYYALLVSQLCRFLKLKYIPILHGGNLTSRLKSHPRWSRLVFKNAKYNVSPSLYLKTAFENAGYDNIIHIPNSIVIDDYSYINRVYDVPNLLWVRSFSEIYNPKLAVHVLNKLKEDYPEARLCMVGPDADGSQREVINLAEHLKLNVEFTGKLEKKEWIKLSENYNMFLNTTNFDNTPVSVIEAMALGLPVVSTNVGGMPYLIANDKDGILVEPNHIENMSSAVLSIMKNTEKRNKIVEGARKKVMNFAWDRVKSLWIKALS